MGKHTIEPLLEPLNPFTSEGSQEQPDSEAIELHAGDLCPVCGSERLDYDGLLNLTCPVCGPVAVGCFT